VSDTYFGM